MAFSLRKMFSNISYFSKTGEGSPCEENPEHYYMDNESSKNIDFECIEPDSTSKQTASSFKSSEPVKKFATKKGSLSDTDLLNSDTKKNRRVKKTLKLDIKKASQSMTENLAQTDSNYVENTPKHISLDCRSADIFSEKFKRLNFNKSFEFDITSESSEEEIDIESFSECSETDLSLKEEESEIKMCRKVESRSENQLIPSVSPESFGDVEMERNEEERMSLLQNYHLKFDKMECLMKKLLSEFQFHIEVSKIFCGKAIVTTSPSTDISKIPMMLGEVTYMDNIKRESPTETWNIVMEKDDIATRMKFQKQFMSLKKQLDQFSYNYLEKESTKPSKTHKMKRSTTFDMHKGKRIHKNMKISTKKRLKHFDFPDYRDAMLNLFNNEIDETDTYFNQTEDHSVQKCVCNCHNQSLNQSDSGLTTKSDNLSNQSITSSIGNFSLDSTTLTAYSDSLDQVISYNSFQDTSLLNTLLQKPGIERITFYVQVHSIQLRSEPAEGYLTKNYITFFCPACEITENEEDGLLRHILSQMHCEKIHFLYKTAYIKKCVSSGKEIQPSTVLNPMKMYRDDNKIVCFGDAMYACSLCFENLIVGESVLMSHCADETHLERREKLLEMFE